LPTEKVNTLKSPLGKTKKGKEKKEVKFLMEDLYHDLENPWGLGKRVPNPLFAISFKNQIIEAIFVHARGLSWLRFGRRH